MHWRLQTVGNAATLQYWQWPPAIDRLPGAGLGESGEGKLLTVGTLDISAGTGMLLLLQQCAATVARLALRLHASLPLPPGCFRPTPFP